MRPTSCRARARLRSQRCRRCGGPWGRPRWYAPNPLHAAAKGLSVQQSMRRTVGCDRCWRAFVADMTERLARIGRC